MPARTIRRTLLAIAAVILMSALVVARAGGEAGVQSAVPELTAPQSLPQAPSVPTPSVPDVPSTPSVPSTPNVPSAPATPSAPSTPSAPEVGTPSTPNVPGTGSVSGRGGSGGGSTGGGGSAGGGSDGGGGFAASRAANGRAGTPGTPEFRRAQAKDRRVARRRRAAREAKLRRDVARLAGCLGEIDALDASVLALRAGLGAERPHSRRATARRLDISTKRTAKVERRGLRGLRRAARGGGCASGVSAVPGFLPPGSMGTSQPAVAIDASPGLRTTAQLSAGSRDSGGREAGGVGGADASSPNEPATTPREEPPVIRQTAETADDGGATGWYVLLALVLALGVALLLIDRRARMYRRAPATMTPAPTGSATPIRTAAGPEAVAGPAIAAAAVATPAPAGAEPRTEDADAGSEAPEPAVEAPDPAAEETEAADDGPPEPPAGAGRGAPDLITSLDSPPPGPPPAPEADMRAAALWPRLRRTRQRRSTDASPETPPAKPSASTAAEATAAQASAAREPDQPRPAGASITPAPTPERASEPDRRRTATVVAGSIVSLAASALMRRRRRR